MIMIVEHIPKESSQKFSKKEAEMAHSIKKEGNICNTAKLLNYCINKHM